MVSAALMRGMFAPVFRNMRRSHWRRGQFIVEILVAIGLMVILLPSLTYVMIASKDSKPTQDARVEASLLMQETYEAIRSIREAGWNNVAINGIFHPVISGAAWVLASGTDARGDLTRSVLINDVYRDSSGVIVDEGNGSVDPSIKKVSVTISWTLPRPSNIQSTWYLTRFLGNQSISQTTVADFTPGVLYNSQITNVSGGEITLANNNKAKWCSPALSSTAIDLPDGPPVAVVATASAVVSAPNDVFVATAPTAGSAIKMSYINVTANTDPPVATQRGIFTLDPSQYSSSGYVPTGINLDNAFKTNDIKYYKSSSGKVYALMATNLPEKEVVAVQVNNGTGDAFQDPVNKIYSYWTFFNTRIYGEAFHNPSAHSAETSNAGDNNGFGTSPTNAYTLNGTYAVDTNSGSNTGTNCTGADKDKHRYYNYGFSLPSGASIDGVEVQLAARVDSTLNAPKMCVQLSWDGGVSWTAAQSTATLTTSTATYTLGSASDTWGRMWADTDFSDPNFRVRIINVAGSTSRDFSLDYVGVKVHYNGISSVPNDEEPFGYGARSLTVLGDRGYVSSGGYIYVFNLSDIDTKSSSVGLDQIGCRIQVDGYDCNPGTGTNRKYASGQTGQNWSDTTSPAHNDCSDGGNIELYASNDLYGVKAGNGSYIYVAVGAGTNPEFEIVNVTDVPTSVSNPAIGSASCGRISGGNAGWKMVGSLDFNTASGTEEAANSVYAKSDGTRAYISSNGGIDGNNDGNPDSKQWYVINTSNKTSPQFLSGTPSTGAQSGYYEATTAANLQLYPRRSLTVLNGQRAILVGNDGVTDTNDAQEYQVLNIDTESTPLYCGGVNYDQGFNDLTSVSEADGDNFVYMVANTNEKQLKIIEGGPDTGIYLTPGTFESGSISATASAAFNRFQASVSQPPQTTIKMQIATAAPVNGSCLNASYALVGPNGVMGSSASAYFTPVGNVISGAIPVGVDGGYANPGQCFKYKVYMDSADSNSAPTFFDASVNFSP